MSTWYRTGSVSYTNGSAVVIGVGTYWASAPDKPERGDAFVLDGKVVEILTVDTDNQLTLQKNSTLTASAVPYEIMKIISQNGMTRVSGQVSDTLNKLGKRVTVSTSAPASGQGQDGDIWIVAATE